VLYVTRLICAWRSKSMLPGLMFSQTNYNFAKRDINFKRACWRGYSLHVSEPIRNQKDLGRSEVDRESPRE